MFSIRCFDSLTRSLAAALLSCACGATAAQPSAAPVPTSCEGGRVQSAAQAARFADCTSVTSDLSIEGTSLADLRAFENLRSVQGTLKISRNSELSQLRGLENLMEVKALVITHNENLRSLSGLGALTRVERFVLRGNGLYSTSGVDKLSEVGELVIDDNRSLISLRGFEGLRSARSLRVTRNHRLYAEAELLPELAHVKESLEISRNRGLSRTQVLGLVARTRPQHELEREAALTVVRAP